MRVPSPTLQSWLGQDDGDNATPVASRQAYTRIVDWTKVQWGAGEWPRIVFNEG
jgi:hypothetical protein